MLQDFRKYIVSNFPFLKEKKILIAISGGVDSVVLTHLMNELNYNISLAHCNFQLREKESDLDALFVKELGVEMSIEVFVRKFNTKEYSQKEKLSTQVAARELRYNYFKELIKKYSFDCVLTAHHADDNLETFLINLTRGTGLEGLTGIPVKNGNIVRPLLSFSRESILQYATENKILWREDKSNSEQKYVRNKIRHQIVPILKEINPSLLNSFSNTSAHLEESKIIVNDRINSLSEKIISKEGDLIKLDINKILNLSNPKAYLYQFLKAYNFQEWNKVYDLLTAQSGKYLLTNSNMLLKDRDFLLLSSTLSSNRAIDKKYYIYEKKSIKIDFPLKISVNNSEKTRIEDENNILVDKNLVIYPLFVRKWKQGDVFYPSGMFGKKKVSKFFKDKKLSLIEKQSTWLLCNNDDKIIWIIGLRADRRFQANKNTQTTLKISI